MDRQVLKLNRPSSTAESAPSDGVDYYSDEDEEVTKQRAEVLDELVKRPLTYIANELTRLRRENARLMQDNAVKERHELNEERRQLREDERRIREEREEHERTKSEFMLVSGGGYSASYLLVLTDLISRWKPRCARRGMQ